LAELSSAAFIPVAARIPDELVKPVPKNTCVVYFLPGRAADARDASQPSVSLGMAGSLIDAARGFGLLANLPDTTRTVLDVLASFPMALDHPHAVMLIDVAAEVRRADARRMGSLKAAVVLYTRGDNARIQQRIQHLLKTYTNSADSVLSSSTGEGRETFVLRDRRAADWVEISWGRLDDFYAVTIGPQVMDAIAGTLRDSSAQLREEDWFRKSWDKIEASRRSFAIYIQLDRLRQAGDAALAGQADAALREAGWSGAQRGLWSVGQEERAIVARGVIERGGASESLSLTAEGPLGAQARRAIPEDADWYAVLDMEPNALVRALSSGYLATRSPKHRARIVEYWNDVQSRSGVSIERDLLPRLGPPWIMHPCPRHALDLPMAWTRMIPVTGDVDTFQCSLNRLLETVRDTMDTDQVTKLRCDSDGVWHLDFGLEGPALAVADGFLIISFSPQAVRENIQRLKRGPEGSHPTPP
jgi:hypothetical protein